MPGPETKYARNGDVHLAYQVSGDGPHDIVLVPGFVSHLEALWDLPPFVAMMERLGRFGRVLRFDKRGIGLSDRNVPVGTIEERMDDVRVVMDAAGIERATLVGNSEGGPMVLLFAAAHPDRTERIVLTASWARLIADDGYPIGLDQDLVAQFAALVAEHWGTGEGLGAFFSGSDEQWDVEQIARLERQAASPGALQRIWDTIIDTDVRQVLEVIQVPTLVLHSPADEQVPERLGRYIADHVDGAQFVEITGSHGDAMATEEFARQLEAFVTGEAPALSEERVLSTVLFTDIVGSTETAARLGDAKWRLLLDAHDRTLREQIQRHRGREIDTAGDGFLVTFDGPARAVECALAAAEAMRAHDLEIRAGVHTGEIVLRGDDVGGIAVHIGARVSALAGASEVLVTRVVKDLVAGSGLTFADRGEHELKGVPDSWQLYAAHKG